MNFWQNDLIRLRAFEPGDADAVTRWNLDSQRGQYLDFLWPPSSRASTEAWLAEQSRLKLEEDRFHFVIETLDGTPVGTIATHHCNPRSGTFSYGLDVAREQRRKGYASAAIIMVLRYYFDYLRYQKVTVVVHADNLPSLRLHERLGFQREGCLRRMVYQNGAFIDEIYFGMTDDEFRQKYGQSPGV